MIMSGQRDYISEINRLTTFSIGVKWAIDFKKYKNLSYYEICWIFGNKDKLDDLALEISKSPFAIELKEIIEKNIGVLKEAVTLIKKAKPNWKDILKDMSGRGGIIFTNPPITQEEKEQNIAARWEQLKEAMNNVNISE